MRTIDGVLVAALVAAAAAAAVSGFYVPSVGPQPYKPNQRVLMRVNTLTSTKTQLPFAYYSLPFCAPEVQIEEHENLGEILAGDQIENSLYELYAKFSEQCRVLCQRVYTPEEGQKFASFIHDEYTVDWILDGLPAAVKMMSADGQEVYYERQFPLGFEDPSLTKQYLFNHIRFTVRYNSKEEPDDSIRIVGFEVEPFSVKHTYVGDKFEPSTRLDTCNDAVQVSASQPNLRIDEGGEVIFTYDVRWEESDQPWATRWDLYLKTGGDDRIHWISITNSALVVLFLSGMVAMIMGRALYRDVARYNRVVSPEEREEETGWKLVHGDVFRPPSGFFGPMMLAVFVGSGAQLFMMALAVMVFAVLGFLSPANRGSLLTALLILYVTMGSFAGYFAARLYKTFHGAAWKRVTLLTSILFPGTVAVVGFIVNLFVWHTGSSQAIPFGSMFALAGLWVGVSMPLVFVGAFFGLRRDEIKPPVSTNPIPRRIPDQPWFLSRFMSAAICGILPFCAVFIELYFIMSSIWLHQIYYVFGFLLLVLIILTITCAEISIVMCYFHLCAEDYRWWWRAFVGPAASAFYLFIYAIFYFVAKLNLQQVASIVMYFSYMFLISFMFFLTTGFIGFACTFIFVRKIYSVIRVD